MIRIQRDAYLQSLELCRIRCNWEDEWHNGEDLLFDLITSAISWIPVELLSRSSKLTSVMFMQIIE